MSKLTMVATFPSREMEPGKWYTPNGPVESIVAKHSHTVSKKFLFFTIKVSKRADAVYDGEKKGYFCMQCGKE